MGELQALLGRSFFTLLWCALSVTAQLFSDAMDLMNSGDGGGFRIAELRFDVPPVANLSGGLCVFASRAYTCSVDTLFFVPRGYSPLNIATFAIKRSGTYLLLLNSFTAQDSTQGHWGATSNTAMQFETGRIQGTLSSYLHVQNRDTMCIYVAGVCKRVFGQNGFWRPLDSTLQVQASDTIEVWTYTPETVSVDRNAIGTDLRYRTESNVTGITSSPIFDLRGRLLVQSLSAQGTSIGRVGFALGPGSRGIRIADYHLVKGELLP